MIQYSAVCTMHCSVVSRVQCGQYSAVFREQFSIHSAVQCAQWSAVSHLYKHTDSGLNGGGLSDRVSE